MFYFNQGDLNQMATQELFLRRRGYNVKQVDVYPALQTEGEYVSALRRLYDNRVIGWWCYRDQLVKYEICTLDEYRAELKKSVEHNH